MTKMTVNEFKAWFDGIMDVIDDLDIDRDTLVMIKTKLATVDNTAPAFTYPGTVTDFIYSPQLIDHQQEEPMPWYTTPTSTFPLEFNDDSVSFNGLN